MGVATGCTWQVMNSFALLDIELKGERVSFYFETFGVGDKVWNMD